jgi:hypothetical protein
MEIFIKVRPDVHVVWNVDKPLVESLMCNGSLVPDSCNYVTNAFSLYNTGHGSTVQRRPSSQR